MARSAMNREMAYLSPILKSAAFAPFLKTRGFYEGTIYAAWGLPAIGAGEKVARTRAALIYLTDTLLSWGASGKPVTVEPDGKLHPWSLPEDVRRRLRPR